MNTRELEHSIQRLLDGTIDETEAEALQDQLKRDPQARALYFSYVGLQQALEYRLARPQPGRDHKIRTQWRLRFERRKRFIIMAAAACIALLVQAVLFRSILFSGGGTVAVKLSPYTLCRIDNPANAKVAPDAIVPGSQLNLDQGTVELSFTGGTKAVVQGPATFTYTKKGEIDLDHGRIWLLIAKQDHGFRVRTAGLEVVDLGTDFGVAADGSGTDEVHVFSGTVDVTNRAPGGETARLHGGEARMQAAAGKLISIPSRPGTFMRSLPESLPLVHFDFTKQSDGRLKVSGDHPDVEKITARLIPDTAPPTLVPGRSGTALSLSGKGDYVATDWVGIAGNAPRTVSFWLKVDPSAKLTNNPAIVAWGNYLVPNGKWKVLLAQEHPGGPAFPRVSFGWHGYDSPMPVNDGAWHHCAITYTGRMRADGHPDVTIHVDGSSSHLDYRDFVPKGKTDGFHEPETRVGDGAKPLTIGYMEEWGTSTAFSGLIEDLRIYAGVLPEKVIHAQAAQPPGR